MSTNRSASNGQWVRSALERYEGPLLRYAVRITGDTEAARDVVQETFLRLCAADPRELDGHLAEWLYTVCRNRAVDVVRKEGRMGAMTEVTEQTCTSPEPSPPAVAEHRETAGEVAEVLATLPESQQEVVRLKFQAGLSYKEISAVTGNSVSNVGFLIHRALKTVRERMRQREAVSHEKQQTPH